MDAIKLLDVICYYLNIDRCREDGTPKTEDELLESLGNVLRGYRQIELDYITRHPEDDIYFFDRRDVESGGHGYGHQYRDSVEDYEFYIKNRKK